jgi:hypothetical protein
LLSSSFLPSGRTAASITEPDREEVLYQQSKEEQVVSIELKKGFAAIRVASPLFLLLRL